VITGTQPPGDMTIQYIPVKRRKGWDGLEGYPGTDIIEITYTFPDGIQDTSAQKIFVGMSSFLNAFYMSSL